jgi:hypothetical protein
MRREDRARIEDGERDARFTAIAEIFQEQRQGQRRGEVGEQTHEEREMARYWASDGAGAYYYFGPDGTLYHDAYAGQVRPNDLSNAIGDVATYQFA